MNDPTSGPAGPGRCDWAGADPLMIEYHDDEWGVPTFGERELFEMLCLEGAQAGLSWRTILARREGYRIAFAGFDIETVAAFGDDHVAALMADSRIIRNRLKILSVIANAAAVIRLWEAGDSLSERLWIPTGGQPIQNSWQTLSDVPARTGLSESLSRDLKRRGFRFVGPTTCYSLMQACGMVNDHLVGCFRHAEIAEGAAR